MAKKKKADNVDEIAEDSVESLFGDKGSAAEDTIYINHDIGVPGKEESLHKQVQLTIKPEPIEIDIAIQQNIPSLIVNRSTRCTICRDQELFDAVNFLAASGSSYATIIDRVKRAFPAKDEAQKVSYSMLSLHFNYHFIIGEYRKELIKSNPDFHITKLSYEEHVDESALQSLMRTIKNEVDYVKNMKLLAAVKTKRLSDLYEEKEKMENSQYEEQKETGSPVEVASLSWLRLHKLIQETEDGLEDIFSELDKKAKDINRIDMLRVQNFAVKLSELIDGFCIESNIKEDNKIKLKDTIARLLDEMTV